MFFFLCVCGSIQLLYIYIIVVRWKFEVIAISKAKITSWGIFLLCLQLLPWVWKCLFSGVKKGHRGSVWGQKRALKQCIFIFRLYLFDGLAACFLQAAKPVPQIVIQWWIYPCSGNTCNSYVLQRLKSSFFLCILIGFQFPCLCQKAYLQYKECMVVSDEVHCLNISTMSRQ